MNIVVNGGTKGIGKEIVRILAKEKDNRILATGRSIAVLKQLSEEAENRNIITAEIDLSDFDQYKKQFQEVLISNFESIDILINMAGTLVSGDFMGFDNLDARRVMEINFFGPATVIRLIKPRMSKGSHIVNISSMGGFQGSSKYKGLSYYSASKAALSCLSECLAEEFRDDGVAVNCLALGSVKTEMLEKAFPGYVAPVDALEMAKYIVEFAKNGNKVFNGKVIPVAINNP